MQQTVTGRCLCGQIQYEVTVDLRRTGLCYCKSCQIKSGSSHVCYIVAEEDTAIINGPIKWYQSIGNSGLPKQHGFCANCGTNLFGKPELWPGLLVVYAGTLNQLEIYKPNTNIWLDEAPSWVCLNQELKCFNQNPE